MAWTRHRHASRVVTAAVALLASVAAAGCGTRVRSELTALSSTTLPRTTTLPPTTSSTVPATTTTLDVATVTAQITMNWETFFNAATPLAQRQAALENGTNYEAALIAASKNPFYAEASAKVSKVQLTGPTQAAVTYDVLVSGSVKLANSTGTAVLQGNVWKVSDQSFCGLVTIAIPNIPGC